VCASQGVASVDEPKTPPFSFYFHVLLTYVTLLHAKRNWITTEALKITMLQCSAATPDWQQVEEISTSVFCKNGYLKHSCDQHQHKPGLTKIMIFFI